MIKIVYGDLLQAKEDIIGHQVNCQGKMNSGVAKSIRQKHPEAYKSYMEITDSYRENESLALLLGGSQIVPVSGDRYVANLFGQFNYGYDGAKYTNEESLYEALSELRLHAENFELSVALPYMIGCDRGGADWKVVENDILQAFEGYEVTLYKLR